MSCAGSSPSVLAAVLAIVLNILPMYDSLWLCVKDAFFNVATIISTTGFCTVDYCQWPMFSQLILLLLMFIGRLRRFHSRRAQDQPRHRPC